MFFFFNDTATTEIYTLSLHDALPISRRMASMLAVVAERVNCQRGSPNLRPISSATHRRSEEHTSELQSRQYLVCRLLLEKKKIALCTTQTTPLPFLLSLTYLYPFPYF